MLTHVTALSLNIKINLTRCKLHKNAHKGVRMIEGTNVNDRFFKIFISFPSLAVRRGFFCLENLKRYQIKWLFFSVSYKNDKNIKQYR